MSATAALMVLNKMGSLITLGFQFVEVMATVNKALGEGASEDDISSMLNTMIVDSHNKAKKAIADKRAKTEA